MKPLKKISRYYVGLLEKLGLLRFSILLALFFVATSVSLQILVNLLWFGEIHTVLIVRSAFFGLVVSPWAVYFITTVVEELEESRQRLKSTVLQLQKMRVRDHELNLELQQSIQQLNLQIEERNKAESERLLAIATLEKEIEERVETQRLLSQANKDKTTFISTISHELRTPLNGIVGLSRILLDSSLTEEQRQYLKTINVSAITLGHIFNDVIDLDKFERHQLELFSAPVDLADFIAELETLGNLMAQQKGLNFEFSIFNDLPQKVSVDGTRLRQVLWNLISNAVKFTLDGSVYINVSAERDQDNVTLVFEIEDTGVGIPAQELDNIFTLYYQVKRDKDNLHAVGTGIGLAVSQQIAHRMAGNISVESEEGFGSVFTLSITVPVLSESWPQLIDVEPEPHRALQVLLVEDIELNITVARAVLEGLGHSVKVAMTGEEALRIFSPEAFDAVLLDIQLPDMTGFDIAQQWREHYSTLPPLIALTANSIQDKQEYVKAGMDDVIAKPLSVEALHQALENKASTQVKEHHIKDESNREVLVGDSEQVLDLDMLKDYIDIVGKEAMLESVLMFETMMPDYVVRLKEFLVQEDKSDFIAEAHKIKGAAGSVGLMRLQQIAQKLQTPETAQWSDKIATWTSMLEEHYLSDIQVLKDWIQA